MRIAQHHEIIGNVRFNDAERFQTAELLVRETFHELSNQGVIVGAFPFGSTQFADHNPFSDFDITIAIQEAGVEAETAAFQDIHNAAKNIYKQTAVPLEVSCYTTAQLRAGLHGFPTPMLRWLKNERRKYPHSVIGGDFINDVTEKSPRRSPKALAEVDDYIDRTRHLLKKSWWQGCYFRPHDLLAVVLNTPHVTGRKVINALQLSGQVDHDRLQDMRKTSIASATAHVFGEESRTWQFYDVIHSDALRYQHDFARQAASLKQS